MNAHVSLLDEALPAAVLGEGARWNAHDGALYWVDITGRLVHRYFLREKKHECFSVHLPVGFLAFKPKGGLVLGLQDGLYHGDFNGNIIPFLKPKSLDFSCRFNDGRCDSLGRLWAGTMAMQPKDNPPLGKLYCIEQGREITVMEDLSLPNGLGWSPDGKIFYFTDTMQHIIWAFDYHADGSLSGKRIFKKFTENESPDGLTVDSEGRVLTALYGVGRIEIYQADGSYDTHIDLPVSNVTSCCFGGEDFKTLFITTAQEGLTAQQKAQQPHAGKVFQVRMKVPGLPENYFTTAGSRK